MNKVLLYLLIALSLNFTSAVLLAQKRQLQFKHITMKDGLSNSNQNCILQDRDGYIWIGTSDGLNKYDGYNIKVYKHDQNDANSIANNVINLLFLDQKKRLWIGTNNGVSLYDEEHDRFQNFKYGKTPIQYARQLVSGMASDKKGNIFITTYNAGYMYILDEKKSVFHFLNPRAGFFPQAQAMLIDSDDHIWIGGVDGFYLYDRASDQYIRYDMDNSNAKFPSLKNVTALCEDNDKIWIGTFGSDIFAFDKKTRKVVYKYMNSQTSEMLIFKIYKDSKHNLWFSNNSGLKCYDSNSKQFYTYTHGELDASSLSTSGTLGIYEDTQGNLWVGGNGGSLNVDFNKKKFNHYYNNPKNSISLTKNTIQSIYQDRNGKIWAGSFNCGIDVIDRSKNSLVHHEYVKNNKQGLGDGSVFRFMEDRKHEMWICSNRSGIQKFDAQTKQFIKYTNDPNQPKSISSNDTRDMLEDSLGNFWIITHGKGLDYFDRSKNEFFHYTQDINNYVYSLTGNWGYKLLIDKRGDLWLATSDGFGKMSKDRKTFKNYRYDPKNANRLSENFVAYLIEDSNGYFWLCTTWGLNKFDPRTEKFTLYTQKDGLVNDITKGVVEDNHGNIWVSTSHGLSMLDIKTNKFTNYYVEDGLQADEFMLGSCFKSPNGELFFGGVNGFNSFFPDSIKKNTSAPQVKINSFKLFYKTVNPGEEGSPLDKDISVLKKIVLDYKMSVFTFGFVALNYIQSDRNQYACKMEGFDKKWIMLGNQREISYTNLNPGKYVFRVKACNNDNVWNENGASIIVIVKPPFWKTVWAFFLYIGLIFIFFNLFRQIILKRAKEKNEKELEIIEWENKIKLEKIEIEKRHEIDVMKLRFFTNISHEFRTPLTLIINPLESLLKSGFDSNKEANTNQIRLMYKNSLRLLRMINQILDIRKLEAAGLKPMATEENIVLFTKDLVQSFHIYATQRNLHFEVKSDQEELLLWFDPEMMEKIIYNLLSNAFKFTLAGAVGIKITSTPPPLDLHFKGSGYAEIQITDTGIGIPKDKLEKIFDRFYQVENKVSHTVAGSGIGLSLVKELVELHKGKIMVESEENKGSLFRIMFPLGNEHFQANEISNARKKEERNSHSSKIQSLIENESIQIEKTNRPTNKNVPSILLIEDNADVRTYLGNELCMDYQIIDAANGQEGLEQAMDAMPDLIISDVMMPVMNGIEFCEKVKNDERTSHIPVILLTARSGEDNVIRGLETGADDYVSKPFNIVLLKARIRNLIENRIRLRNRFKHEIDIQPSEITVNQIDKQFIERALKLVEDNMSNFDYTPDEFIENMNMSKTQLYKKLKSITGLSVSIFIRSIRLKRATLIMRQEKYPISEIAYMVGFNDPAYFTKCFREYFNESPSQYINKFHVN